MSKLVKILLIQHIDCDDYYSQSIIRESINDWEEISDEDFQFLKQYLTRVIDVPYGFSATLVVKDNVPVVQRINSVKELIATEQAAEAAAKAKRDKAAQERQQARMLKKAASELALLEELKKKYEDNA